MTTNTGIIRSVAAQEWKQTFDGPPHQVFTMVGNRGPVVGRLFLDHLAGLGVLDGLAPGLTVGVVGVVAGAEGEGVRRCRGVQVLLAEIDIVQRVRLAGIAVRLADGVGGEGAADEHRRTQA